MKALKFSETFKWTRVPFLVEQAFIIKKRGFADNKLISNKVLLFDVYPCYAWTFCKYRSVPNWKGKGEQKVMGVDTHTVSSSGGT